jgi:DNA replication initiation complex subunit (GINS family)
MTDTEIKITYDTLYDILRREKNSSEVQELDPGFFNNVISYLKEKQELLEGKKNDQGLFGFEEKKKVMQQIENAHKLLKDIYEWREKKIILLARDLSRTNSKIANTENLLEEEKQLFDSILSTLDKFRGGIINKILVGEAPEMAEKLKPLKSTSELQEEREASSVLIKFVETVPVFMGPNMEKFGPFEQDQTAELPNEIAQLMIKNNRAVIIK